MIRKRRSSSQYELSLEKKMEMIRMSVRAVTRGYKTSRLITGTPGIGKSFAVIEEITSEIENNKNLKYEHISGGIRDAVSFYTVLCDNNDENTILILDDVNTVFTNKECREILRAATTNVNERKITYASNKIVKGKTFYRPRTDFFSKVIIITNIPKRKIDGGILSRTSPIEILANNEEIFEWVGLNLKEAPPHDMPLRWKEVVYDFIKVDVGIDNLKQFDFRVFEDALLWYGSCVEAHGVDEQGDKKVRVKDDWKSYVYTLCS